jgi:hypothetical protein
MTVEKDDRIQYTTTAGVLWSGVVVQVWPEGRFARIQWDWDDKPSSWVAFKDLAAKTECISAEKEKK